MIKKTSVVQELVEEVDSSHCLGCEDDFYNGKNPFGIDKCWHFDRAELVMRKQVDVSQRPPWNQEPIEVPDCYRKKGFTFVLPDRIK